MTSLLSLELSYNRFIGTIPVALTSLPQLGVFQLSGNYLTGTIPPEVGFMDSLVTLELGTNDLTGTVPAAIGHLNNLTNLYLYENHLHGVIPFEVGQMSNMVFLSMDHNLLSGTLPLALSFLKELTSFLFHENLFTGSLEGVFNATRQPFVTSIQVSHNQLTGTLPDSLFALRKLTTVVLVSNCFTGRIPQSICDCDRLTTLSLDGIKSASSPGISTAYVLNHKIRGGVPSCLFAMPALTTLHLSGNGLTGSFPENITLSDNLIDLTLSHNKLTGTIPRVIQRHNWYNLDLSYNKFGGVLYDDFASAKSNMSFEKTFANSFIYETGTFYLPPSALALRNNRLSHDIPTSLFNQLNISVLSGNLFGCELDHSDLPSNDEGRSTYQCGSADFNIAYYLWLAAVLFTVLVAFNIYYWRHSVDNMIGDMIGGVFTLLVCIKRWLNIVNWNDQENTRSKGRLHHYKYVMKVCEYLCSAASWCTVYMLVVTLRSYLATSSYYSTHTYEYAWTVSAGFLSGYPAFAVLLVFFLLLLVFMLALFQHRFRALRHFLREQPQLARVSVGETTIAQLHRIKYSSLYEKVAIYAAFILINFIVVGGGNIAFVYVLLYQDSKYLTAAQIAMSIFKVGWNSLGSVMLIRWTHHKIAASSSKEWKRKGSGFFATQLFVAMFNFIAIPCLVVGSVNPNCFTDLFVDAPTVESHYLFEECALFGGRLGCIISVPVFSSTYYNPPFTYSFQCSSSLVTSYAPTFIYTALILTFINPLIEVVLQRLHKRRSPGTWLAKQLDHIVPPVLQDVSAEDDASRPPYDIFNPYFDANQLLVNVITYFGLLLTFGLVFPPLAVALLLSIYVVIYTSKIEVGRFLTNSIDQSLHKNIDAIERECLGVGSIPKLRQCVKMLFVFTCLFYTLFLFDTLGDATGAAEALWVVFLLMSLPGLVYAAYTTYVCVKRRRRHLRGNNKSAEPSSASIELNEFALRLAPAQTTNNNLSSSNDDSCIDSDLDHQQPPSQVDESREDAYTLNALFADNQSAVV